MGFAAGVMTAASYWSLLNPAIEMAEQSGYYGSNGELAIVPVALGFLLGAAFVASADNFLPYLVSSLQQRLQILVNVSLTTFGFCSNQFNVKWSTLYI